MKTNSLYYRIQQSGFTLVEIMVALALGLILIAGMIQLFVSNKATYRTQEALGRLQENGRFAMDFIVKDLRMAGFTGCLSREASNATSPNRLVNVLNSSNTFLYNFAIPMQGFDATSSTAWTPILDTTIQTGVTSHKVPTGGTDVITIRRTVETSAAITTPGMTANTTNPINITMTANDLNSGNIIIIADCKASTVTQVVNDPIKGATTIDHAAPSTPSVIPGNNILNLGRTFNDKAAILRAEVRTYFIAPGASGAPALWRLLNNTPRGGNNPVELIEGVEDMQILYGEDNNNDGAADIYRTATVVTNWDRVVSVRISMLLRSLEDNLTNQHQTYVYNSTTPVTAPDRRIRRVFTKTLSVRNKAIGQ